MRPQRIDENGTAMIDDAAAQLHVLRRHVPESTRSSQTSGAALIAPKVIVGLRVGHDRRAGIEQDVVGLQREVDRLALVVRKQRQRRGLLAEPGARRACFDSRPRSTGFAAAGSGSSRPRG